MPFEWHSLFSFIEMMVFNKLFLFTHNYFGK